MNISKNKKFTAVFLLFLIFACSACFNIYAQGQQSDAANLQQVKILLNEGLEYLKADAFTEAKSKFEEALKIAPKDMAGEIKSLLARVDDVSAKRERELLTKDVLIKSEEEAKKLSELQRNIIQFEKEQKKQAYLTEGELYFDKGEYEQALLEFNKILVISSQDKDAIANIERTKRERDREEMLTRTRQAQEYWVNAKSFYRSKKYDEAIVELRRILAIDPTNTQAIEYMELMKEMKLFGAKMEEAERLELMVNKGREYLRDRDYDKAIQIWQQVLIEKKDYPGVEVLIAQAEFNKTKGKEKVAQEKYRNDREEKMLAIDRAFVPVLGGVKEKIEKETEIDEELLAIERIKKTMKEKKVTLEFTDADLRSVILFLSRQSGVNMMVDESIFQTGAAAIPAAGAMPPAGMRGERPGAFPGGPGAEEVTVVPVNTYNVTASLRDISLADALSLILRSRGLDYEIYPNVIWISSSDRIANVPMEALETRIFDLQFGGPFRGQIRPEPLQLETISFGESNTGGGGNTGSGGNTGGGG